MKITWPELLIAQLLGVVVSAVHVAGPAPTGPPTFATSVSESTTPDAFTATFRMACLLTPPSTITHATMNTLLSLSSTLLVSGAPLPYRETRSGPSGPKTVPRRKPPTP